MPGPRGANLAYNRRHFENRSDWPVVCMRGWLSEIPIISKTMQNGAGKGTSGFNRRASLFLLCVAALVYLRLTYQASYFPPFFDGEEASALDGAKNTIEYAHARSWMEAIKGSFPQYNKGYIWCLVPFYEHLGYDVRIITFVLPVFFSLFVASFFTLFRKAYPKTPLAAFALVALFSVLCLCLRRYKWHSLTYLTAISVYIFFLPLFSENAAQRARLWRGLGISLFVFSCFFYYGGLLYAPPFIALMFAFSGKKLMRRGVLWGFASIAAFAAMFLVTCKLDDLWHLRINVVLAYAESVLSREGLLDRWGTMREYFTVLLSIPFIIFFLVGLVASLRRMRQGDRFAQVNTVLFASVSCFELVIEGVGNPDQLNWSMIPTLGVLLVGASASLNWIRTSCTHGFALGLGLAALAGWNEVHRYPFMNRDADQPYIQDRNTTTQGVLVLRMISEDTSNDVQYFLPAPSVTGADGGFDYNVGLKRVDYANALAKVTFFKDEEDLRRRFLALKNGKPVVVYLSVGYPNHGAEDTLKNLILGQYPTIIHPYEDIYKIPYLIRRYRILPSHFPPRQLDSMVLWLKSTAGTQGSGDLKVWMDQTGLGNDATPVRDDHPPRVVSHQINGLPAVSFGGASALRLPPGLLGDSHSAQIIAVVRVRNFLETLNVLWNLGWGWGSTYKGALHFEDFGNADTNAVALETVGQISNYFVYDTAVNATGTLTYRWNGQILLTKHVPDVRFQPYPDLGGYGNGCFLGEIAEIMLYDRVLTASEQAKAYAYLATKFKLPSIQKNLKESDGQGQESQQAMLSDRKASLAP